MEFQFPVKPSSQNPLSKYMEFYNHFKTYKKQSLNLDKLGTNQLLMNYSIKCCPNKFDNHYGY